MDDKVFALTVLAIVVIGGSTAAGALIGGPAGAAGGAKLGIKIACACVGKSALG